MRITSFRKQLPGGAAPFLFLTLLCITEPSPLAQGEHFPPAGPVIGTLFRQSLINCAWSADCVKTLGGARQFRQSLMRVTQTAKRAKSLPALSFLCFPEPACAAILIHEPVQRPSDKSFLFMWDTTKKS